MHIVRSRVDIQRVLGLRPRSCKDIIEVRAAGSCDLFLFEVFNFNVVSVDGTEASAAAGEEAGLLPVLGGHRSLLLRHVSLVVDAHHVVVRIRPDISSKEPLIPEFPEASLPHSILVVA